MPATPRTAALVMLIAGIVILGYVTWALYSGWVISTWGQFAHRGMVIYWVTVLLLALLGAVNLVMGARGMLGR